MIKAKQSLIGRVNVGTIKLEPPLTNLEVTPTKETQEFNHVDSYGYDKVSVNAIPDEYIIPDGTLEVGANGDVDVTTFKMARVGVYTPPTLQDKSVTITENGTTNIVADEGFDGLGNVEVNTNVQGETPEIGFVVNEYNEDGYVKEITFYSDVPVRAFTNSKNSGYTRMFNYIEKVNFYPTVSTIGDYAFASNPKITEIVFNNVSELGMMCFYECNLLNIKTLPNITVLWGTAFGYCKSLTQISIPNLVTLKNVTGYAYNVFYHCTSLKAVWLGSGFKGINFMFGGCENINKIFIDLPRATVETLTGYSYAFSVYSNSGSHSLTPSVIVCNDDEDFMTQEEFDAIDWSTYTE